MISKEEIEEGTKLAPRYDENGVIPCIAVSAETGKVLMLAYMNDIALQKTIETGEVHYWSRSRNALWHKGATSGLVQKVVEMRIDCDQDTVLVTVEMPGTKETQGREASCHTGRYSCFYREIPIGAQADPTLQFKDDEKLFDPTKVYD